ncbi:MAG: ankyrin repeat domain-containing protein [Shewanella sp.]|nr:ankyrin repeat domain-containing protein [Shewanella sp.]
MSLDGVNFNAGFSVQASTLDSISTSQICNGFETLSVQHIEPIKSLATFHEPQRTENIPLQTHDKVVLGNIVQMDLPKDFLSGCQKGNLSVINAFESSGVSFNAKDPARGKTALIVVSAQGHEKLVDYFISKKAELDCFDTQGMNALMYAIKNGHLGIALKLLDAGASVTLKSPSKAHLLIFTIQNKRYELVQPILDVLDKKAEVNKVNSLKQSALYFAVKQRDIQTIIKLIKHGAKAGITDVNKKNIMMLAIEQHLKSKESNQDLDELAVTLVINFENIDHMDDRNQTALFYAAEAGLKNTTLSLLKAGADVNLTDVDGQTVVDVATFETKAIIESFIIENSKSIHDC